MDLFNVFWINLNFGIIYVNIDLVLYVLFKQEPALSSGFYKTHDLVDLAFFLGGRALLATFVYWVAGFVQDFLHVQGLWVTVFWMSVLAVLIKAERWQLDKVPVVN